MSERGEYRHVFGPVPSRRLGRSLGVDLVPFKTCTFDCIYCQIGRTTKKSVERDVHVPEAEIIDDLRKKLDEGAAPDYVTLSGSGEPTLHSGLGHIISAIKQLTTVPVALLTNGSLLSQEEVRTACLQADVVVPSLDAGDERLFEQINRPHPSLTLSSIVDGLITFRKVYAGQIWLEVFLLDGLNASEPEVEKLKDLIERVKPDRVHLNTAVRPTAEQYAQRVPEEELERLRQLFGPRAEVIADFQKLHDAPEFACQREDVLALLKRRPCSVADVAAGLSIHKNEAVKFLGELEQSGQIASELRGDTLYYGVHLASESLGEQPCV